MNALVVGADRLGNIPQVLADFGIRVAHHVDGRQPSHQRKAPCLPRDTELVILLTDFLGHNVMKSFREAAGREKLPVLACRRSVCCVQKSLEAFAANGRCAGCPASDPPN